MAFIVKHPADKKESRLRVTLDFLGKPCDGSAPLRKDAFFGGADVEDIGRRGSTTTEE